MKKIIIFFLFISFSVYSATLSQAINYALKNAPQFQENNLLTLSQVEQLKKVLAIYDTHLSASSEYMKKVNTLNNQTSRSRTNTMGVNKNIGLGATVNTSVNLINNQSYQSSLKIGADINLLQNLLGRIDKNSITVSTKEKEELNNSLKQTRESLILGVIELYLSTLQHEQHLTEYQNLYESVKSLKEATTKKRKIGAADERNVLQMRAKLLNYEMSILEIKRGLEASYEELETITGGGKFKKLQWPFKKSVKFSNDSLSLKQLRIKQTRLQLEQKSFQWKKLPKLKLSMAYDTGRDSYNAYSLGTRGLEKGIGLFLTIPFENTIAKSNYKSKTYELLANKITLKRAHQEFEDNKRNFERSLSNYFKQINIAKNAIEIQQKRYGQEFKAYTQGRIGITDINSAQNDLINSKITYIDKKRTYYKYMYGSQHLYGNLASMLER